MKTVRFNLSITTHSRPRSKISRDAPTPQREMEQSWFLSLFPVTHLFVVRSFFQHNVQTGSGQEDPWHCLHPDQIEMKANLKASS